MRNSLKPFLPIIFATLIGIAFCSIFIIYYDQTGHTMKETALVILLLSALLTTFFELVIDAKKNRRLRIAVASAGIVVTCLWLSSFSIALSVSFITGTLIAFGIVVVLQDETLKMVGVVLVTIVVLLLALFLSPATIFVPPVLSVVEYSALLEGYNNQWDQFFLKETFVVERSSVKSVKNATWYNPNKEIVIEKMMDGHDLYQLINDQLQPLVFPLKIYPSEKHVFVVTRLLRSRSAGFLLRECEFEPTLIKYVWSQFFQGEKYTAESVLNETRYAKNSRVEVGLPKSSFTGANAKAEVLQYGNIDIVSWKLPFDLLQRPIGFVYLKPPFHTFKWLVAPFAGISSFGEGIIIAIGIGIPILIVIPLLAFKEAIKKKLVNIFHRKKEHKKRPIGFTRKDLS